VLLWWVTRPRTDVDQDADPGTDAQSTPVIPTAV